MAFSAPRKQKLQKAILFESQGLGDAFRNNKSSVTKILEESSKNNNPDEEKNMLEMDISLLFNNIQINEQIPNLLKSDFMWDIIKKELFNLKLNECCTNV